MRGSSDTVPLDWQRVARTLHTDHVAATPNTLIYLEEVLSTNTYARALAANGAAHGTVVIADNQTAGRGRLGRSWSIPPRTGLTLSVVLRPSAQSGVGVDASYAVMATAIAVYDLACNDLKLPGRLKWPNDLLFHGRKACGILGEAMSSQGQLALVVGIGINVNATPPGLEDQATCLAAIMGAPLEREAVLGALLHRLDSTYGHAETREVLWQRWRAALETVGRPVVVYTSGKHILRGLAEDVTSEGALQVRDAAGQLHTLFAGDVTLSPPIL